MNIPPNSGPTTITNRDFAKGAGTTLLARLGAVFETISQPLYVLMFGLAGYGLYAVLWAAITLIENVADLGMPAALQRVVPQAASPQDELCALRCALLIGVIPSIFLALAIMLGAQAIAPLFNAADADAAMLVSVIQIYAWSLPLWAFVEVATAALRSKRMFGAEIRLRLLWEQVIRLGIAVALFFAGFGTMALFYAHLLSLVLTCLLALRLLTRYFDLRHFFSAKSAQPVFSEMLGAGLAVLPSNVVARLFSDGPPLLLNALLAGATGAISAALYVIARKISSIVQLVRTAFNYVLAPLASAASKGESGQVARIYGFVTRLSFALALPLGAVLGGGGSAILRLFGADASAALPALVILTVARIVEAVIGGAAPIQQVTSGFRSQLAGSLGGLATAAAICLWLMPAWGVTGMAIAVGAGVITSVAIPLYQLHLIAELHPFAAPFLQVMARSVLIALVTLMAALLITQLPQWSQLPMLIVALLIALWISARFALPLEDRRALGSAATKLRLVSLDG